MNPPHLQILGIDREGMIDDVIKHKHMTSFVQKIIVHSNRHKFAITQNARKRCCWHCNIKFDLHDDQSHYYTTMAYTGV